MESQIPLVLQEIKSGAGLGLAKAAQQLPGTDGRPVNPATVFRWCVSGVRVPTGERVRLEHARIGSRLFTSEMAVERFVMRLTNGTTAPTPAPRSPAERRRAAERAGRELEKMGA